MADTTGLPCLLLTVTLGGTYPCSASVISADRPGGWCNAETCPPSAGWSFRAILRWKPVFICGMLGGCHTPNLMEHRDAPSPLHHLRGTCTWGSYHRTFYRGWGGGYSQNSPGKAVMCWLQADLLPIIKKNIQRQLAGGWKHMGLEGCWESLLASLSWEQKSDEVPSKGWETEQLFPLSEGKTLMSTQH